MANDICARIIFQVLARDNFFVMKQLKIDKGKTDLRFYFSRLFLKISNRWWTQAIITKYQTIKEHKENQRNKYLKRTNAPGKKNFNSVFLVQRVGVETADHLCFRTSAWTDRHSLFPRAAWFTSRQKCERSDQVWRRSETRQLFNHQDARLSTNYERAHFKRIDEWRQSGTTTYYFTFPQKQKRRRKIRRQTCAKNLLCIFFMVSRWQTGSFSLLPQSSYFFTSPVGTRAILPTWNKVIPAPVALPPFFCWRLFRAILVVCPHSLFFSPPSSPGSQLTRETGQQNGLAGLAKRSEKIWKSAKRSKKTLEKLLR